MNHAQEKPDHHRGLLDHGEHPVGTATDPRSRTTRSKVSPLVTILGLGSVLLTSVLSAQARDVSELLTQALGNAFVGADGVPEGRAWGDIHVRSIDGAIFSFQAVGEFVAASSPSQDLIVQLRLEPAGLGSRISIATAVAAQIDSSRASIELGRSPMLYLDGQPTELPEVGLDLPDGGFIEASNRGYVLVWKDGTRLTVEKRGRHLDAFLLPAPDRQGKLSGLFGDFDGNSANDAPPITAASATSSDLGRTLGRTIAQLLLGFADDQRLEQRQSRFDYRPGESTRTFTDVHYPSGSAEIADLDPTAKRRAEQACTDAGVVSPELLEACVIDLGLTGDESFVDSAVAVQLRDTPTDGLTRQAALADR